MSMKLVSVVIPIYNSEKVLERCIESVIKQEHSNLDIILINDGSTDKSEEICEEYLKKDSRIRYFYQKNQGVSCTRNYGIDVAKGEYIIFIDSDDYIENNMISSLLNNVDMSICGYSTYYLKDNMDIPYITNYNELEKKVLTQKDFFKHLGYWMLNFNIICMPWNKLFNLKKIRDNNLYFPYDVSYGEDLIFNLKYFDLMQKMFFTPEVLYHYELGNSNSLEGKYKDDIFQQQKEQFIMILSLLKERKQLSYYNKRNLACYFIGRVEYCIKMLFHEQCLLSKEEKRERIKKIVEDDLVTKSLDFIWKSLGDDLNEIVYLIKERESDLIMQKYSEALHKNNVQVMSVDFYLDKLIQYWEAVRMLGIKIIFKKVKRKLGRR